MTTDPAKAIESLQISKTKELKGTEKRDTLIAIEKKYQKKWAEDKIFEVEAPSLEEHPLGSISAAELRAKYPKFFSTVAYQYVNGVPHAGHVFSQSKVEFMTGTARMSGKRALWPVGWHATGMPIQSASDKLRAEVEKFGPQFEKYEEEPIIDGESPPAPDAANATREDVTKFTTKKSKATAKTAKLKYQFQIMQSMGIPKEEIHKFATPEHWLNFFPQLCTDHMSSLGFRVDWRRSFITTDVNPYYDAFVRWQMNRLKELGKIKFGKRYTIYSIKDGQPCMDHDRSEGEGVGSQEYTALKMKVLEWAPKAREALEGKLPADANVFLVPATLRPETMYGQNAVFVSPKITYGIFRASETDYYVMTHRAARNMAYQGILIKEGEFPSVSEIDGSAMIGTLVNAPLSVHTGGVRVLPMESILPTKGTGVVTSVPSDSPADYVMTMDLRKKAAYYGIEQEWAELEIIPIIDTPTGDLIAKTLVESLKISSPKDTVQLDKAKDAAYTEGYYKGRMKIGAWSGQPVEQAKPLVRKHLIDEGLAFPYAEPERKIVSRSSDECIVSLMDQWYLDYGEESWRNTALSHLANADGKGLNTFSSDTRNAFEGVLNWLNQWACARTYGLGTKLPWDPQFLVESLSDSTIYPCYYTISHYLQKDIYGNEKGTLGIAPEQLTDEVFDYIFCRRELDDKIISESNIPKSSLETMRRSFEYWYPLDVRSSGKDLINNHLTFFLYIHIALFPPEYWPRGIRTNGHLLLNGDKMSKSTGNFLTLDDMVKKYGADASRIGLADAGDSMGDSNFEEDVANQAILRLYTLHEWCEDAVKNKDQLRTGEWNYFDKIFNNEMNALAKETIHQYHETSYKLALKAGFYDFNNTLSFYRESSAGTKMHHDLVIRFIELQCLLIAVIAPHWAESVWLEILQKPTSIQQATFPEIDEVDLALAAARKYISYTASNVNSAEGLQLKKKAKGKELSFDPKKPKKLTIYMNERFPAWQDAHIEMLRSMWDAETKSVDDKALNSKIPKAEMKRAMPFIQGLKRRLLAGEPAEAVFERKLAFDEKKVLVSMTGLLKRSASLVDLQIINVQEGGKQGTDVVTGETVTGLPSNADGAQPGTPTFLFANVETS
ncbi:hypothetical protein ACRALDRAFT_1064467 [Sodiomyces alcalophilus JCM 7366]|uniref:uncharacterized protein n=1 Tax=Sodiomyces alcalophilus JCM 7366 TaxID=591952 RepID=UPI0039B5F2E0